MAVRWSHGLLLARHAPTPHVLRFPPELPGWPGTCRPPDCAPSRGLDPRALRASFPREPAPPQEPAAGSARLFVVTRAMTNRLTSQALFFGSPPGPVPAHRITPLKTRFYQTRFYQTRF